MKLFLSCVFPFVHSWSPDFCFSCHGHTWSGHLAEQLTNRKLLYFSKLSHLFVWKYSPERCLTSHDKRTVSLLLKENDLWFTLLLPGSSINVASIFALFKKLFYIKANYNRNARYSPVRKAFPWYESGKNSNNGKPVNITLRCTTYLVKREGWAYRVVCWLLPQRTAPLLLAVDVSGMPNMGQQPQSTNTTRPTFMHSPSTRMNNERLIHIEMLNII